MTCRELFRYLDVVLPVWVSMHSRLHSLRQSFLDSPKAMRDTLLYEITSGDLDWSQSFDHISLLAGCLTVSDSEV